MSGGICKKFEFYKGFKPASSPLMSWWLKNIKNTIFYSNLSTCPVSAKSVLRSSIIAIFEFPCSLQVPPIQPIDLKRYRALVFHENHFTRFYQNKIKTSSLHNLWLRKHTFIDIPTPHQVSQLDSEQSLVSSENSETTIPSFFHNYLIISESLKAIFNPNITHLIQCIHAHLAMLTSITQNMNIFHKKTFCVSFKYYKFSDFTIRQTTILHFTWCLVILQNRLGWLWNSIIGFTICLKQLVILWIAQSFHKIPWFHNLPVT